MNFRLNKADGTLLVDGIPLGSNKMDLSVDAFHKDGTPTEEGTWSASIGINLTATLSAIKVEEVTTDVPLLDGEGVQVEVDGVPQTQPKTETVKTVLDSKVIDLKIL